MDTLGLKDIWPGIALFILLGTFILGPLLFGSGEPPKKRGK